MKIISNEDMYVSTTWGAAIRLYAGEPKEVGDDIGYVALQQGAKEVKDVGEIPKNPSLIVSEEETIEDAIVIEVDEDKGGKLEFAMKQILENGDPKDFTTDGLPKQSAIKAIFGEQVNSDEREEAWAKVILNKEEE